MSGRFCLNCGTKIKDDAVYCENCGKRYEAAAQGPGMAPPLYSAPVQQPTSITPRQVPPSIPRPITSRQVSPTPRPIIPQQALQISQQRPLQSPLQPLQKKSLLGVIIATSAVTAFIVIGLLVVLYFALTNNQLSDDGNETVSNSGTTICEADFELEPVDINSLIGIWGWDEDNDWIYTIYADGSGKRGFLGMLTDFSWSLADGNNLIIDDRKSMESWTISITDDTLVLCSRQALGITYTYNLINTDPTGNASLAGAGGVLTPAEIFAKNADAVFSIEARDAYGNWYWGTGFFIDAQGRAITNHHVMADMVYANIITNDGKKYDITGYYYYSIDNNDLAVIQVDVGKRSVHYVTLGDSKSMMIGDSVYALGNPEGEHHTFTPGIISRFPPESINIGIYSISDMIQFTAPIYGGNSGGPLFNDKGEVIGINSSRRTDRDSVGWAIPISRVDLSVIDDTLHPLPIVSTSRRIPPVEDVMAEGVLWLCEDSEHVHNWFCALYFTNDGRFVDRDGDGGEFEFTGTELILDFDEFQLFRFGAELCDCCGNILTIKTEPQYVILIRQDD